MKQTESLHVRVTSDDLTDIDQVATSMGVTRSAAIRTLFQAARLLIKQDESELKRISLAKRTAEQNGTSFYEEYLFHLAREIHQVNGGTFADAWLEAGRQKPTIRDLYMSQQAAAIEQDRARRRYTVVACEISDLAAPLLEDDPRATGDDLHINHPGEPAACGGFIL